mmetsp:Transcript_31006/g.40949  ORF Transcript_31006/g.40949 Transcript_31006/m.40949 type:complete len:330 (-) Transcript_31006:438-1427(-)|eukprot:CAMPEP_0117752266 /NCGR_PEP_ID=MMETSP0947-20121206/11506_1 /TAXON_ID=44440 /ORGANISM="Chattonella subsalsa, Strain CCMP2191" /LENGTH=329 /DNA_ID=CAMNT_0005570881 /DNA_START=86 /DNA_END=1075 /DNA_ORIENTATION=-
MVEYEVCDSQFGVPPRTSTEENMEENRSSSAQNIFQFQDRMSNKTFKKYSCLPILIVIILLQMIWILGLTIHVQLLSNKINNNALTQQMATYLDLMGLLNNSIQSNAVKIETIESSLGTEGEVSTQMSISGTEVRVGSDGTDDIRLLGNKVWFEQAHTHIQINELVKESFTEWSTQSLEINVGTTVTWHWRSNENIVEASENYAVKNNPSFFSGALQTYGELTHKFETPGIYYFMSENSESLRGNITVKGFYVEAGNLHFPGYIEAEQINVKSLKVEGSNNIPGTVHSICSFYEYHAIDCCPSDTVEKRTGSLYDAYGNILYICVCLYQ